MIDLSNNPFSDTSGNPVKGKEIEWLKWNSKARRELNPYIDANGKIIEYNYFSKYISDCKEQYQKDLLKIPTNLKQQIEDDTRLHSERMQVEATGRH
ncbi:hypothetical protein [Polaribacter sp. HL-MS24]|uniref:hypothetical protein n=1 Tax=Polaribacter sp. HL-MS24 TaxID=3077735 RepID=UPI002934F6C1|nr:hypothetical protein [Polaribacter sp. HL-MS24]WOC39644.1 hypothetical protein RRF69_08240 [Polaribacter sp. HL-MS24]